MSVSIDPVGEIINGFSTCWPSNYKANKSHELITKIYEGPAAQMFNRGFIKLLTDGNVGQILALYNMKTCQCKVSSPLNSTIERYPWQSR